MTEEKMKELISSLAWYDCTAIYSEKVDSILKDREFSEAWEPE